MSDNIIDQSTDIRPGEELEIGKIETFLKDTIQGLEGELTVKQFPSGMSNLTYHLVMGDLEMVLRRPPFGSKVKSAHDMNREFKILNALYPVFPYCPKPLAYTEDLSIIGCPFYVMEKKTGIIVRRDLPPGISFNRDEMRSVCDELLNVQIELHSLDYKAIGLDRLAKPQGYVERQVKGWIERYENAYTDNAPTFEDVKAYFLEKMPPDAERPAVIHNDYRFDNVVFDMDNPLKIIGVLDWEMATVGDPLMDIGNSLAYWVQADDPEEVLNRRLAPSHLAGALTREEMAALYGEKSGRSVKNFEYYLGFGVFRLAVIIQQIYYRFTKGLTQDERFGPLVETVWILERLLKRELEHVSG